MAANLHIPTAEPAGFSRLTFRLAVVTCLATTVLIAAGGLVTSTRSGDAVDTWPLPLVLPMVGGVAIELGHRQIAGIVGLLALALAIRLQMREDRAWVRLVGWAAFALVLTQAGLGGARIAFPEDQYPEQRRIIAIVHACVAPLFFCLTAVLAAATSASFRRDDDESRIEDPGAGSTRILAVAVCVGMYLQIVLGAVLRHADSLLAAHIGWAVVVLCAAGCWVMMSLARYGDRAAVVRPLRVLMALLLVQLGLGVFSLVLFNPAQRDISGRAIVPTLHVAVGVLCLGASVVGAMYAFRFLRRGSPAFCVVSTTGAAA